MSAVPIANLLGICFTLLITVFLPIIVWILLASKFKKISFPILAGTLGFIIPQLFIRMPALSLLSVCPFYRSFYTNHFFLYGFFLALTAALFETAGRFLVFKFLLSGKKGFAYALGAGYGHGISEAVLLVGISYINNLIFSLMINSGNMPQFEGSEQILATLTDTAPELFFSAGTERVFTVIFHMMASVLLAYFLYQKKTAIGLTLCVFLHTALDFISIVILRTGKGNILSTELFITAAAAVSFYIITFLKRRVDNIYPDEGGTAVPTAFDKSDKI